MTKVVPLVISGIILVIAALQLIFFLPLIAGNQAVDVAFWNGGPILLRVDGLSLIFGVIWSLALAGLIFGSGADAKDRGLLSSLILLGLLGMAYSRDPLIFVASWELAGLALWLGPGITNSRERLKLAIMVHGPGLLVLVAAIGWLGPFAPPAGGALREWPLIATLLIGIAVLVQLGLSTAWSDGKSPGLMALYGAGAPFILSKMLVGGRWDAWGTWTLALMGMVALLAIAWVTVSTSGWKATPGQVFAGLSVAAFGLATLSPVAGLGAVLVLSLAAVLAAMGHHPNWNSYFGAVVVAGSLAGLWLLSHGALAAGYGLPGVAGLPIIIFVAGLAQWATKGGEQDRAGTVATATLVLLGISAIYPQWTVEWVAQPAVDAMAGGVAAPAGLVNNWGIGLQVASPGEVVLAALPATGIAVALFMAWVVLYWAKQIASRRAPIVKQKV